MNTRTLTSAVFAALLLLFTGSLYAADRDQDRDRDRTQLQDKDMIYGWELMSVEERAQHRAKLRSLNTEEEREAFRQEHHKLMQARAREKGVTLPEVPRQRMMNRNIGGGAGTGAGGGGGGGGAGKGR